MANSVFKIENGLTVVGGDSTFGNTTTSNIFRGPVTIDGTLTVSGASQFTGGTTTTGTVSSASDYVPSVDNLFLGSATNRWQGHFANVITYGTGVLGPSTNTAGQFLGSATRRWELNANTINASGLSTLAGSLISGTTNVSTFNATTANVTGLTGLAGGLIVTGLANAGGLIVTGLANAGGLIVTGTANVGTFNATSLSTLALGLVVTGQANISAGLIVTGTANVSSNLNVGTFGVSNGTAITNTSISVGNSTANALLNYNLISVANISFIANLVAGALNIGSTTVNGSFINVSTLLATGIANVTGALSVTGAANALSTFGVRGNTVFAGNVTIGTAGLFVDALGSRTSIGSLSNPPGTTLYIDGSLHANGTANAMLTFGINGLTTAAGGLVVTGIANVSVKLNAGAANVTGLTGLAGGLDVTGLANAGGLIVTGLANAGGLNVIGSGGGVTTARFATGAFPASGINIVPNATAGTLNALVAQGDILLNFSSGGIESGNLVIAPWSSTSSGIKINGLIKDIALVGNSFTFTTGNSNFDSGVLFVDALNNRVGIGTTTPDANLAVVGTANVSGASRFANTLSVIGAVTFSNIATFSSDVTIAGNLTVSGTRTYVNTTTLDVGDNIITLNADVTGAPSENSGIEINRGSSANSRLQWNETSDTWQITSDGTNYYNVVNEGGSNTNLDSGTLFIDAVNSRVGINNTAPLVALRVTGAADISSTANVQGNANVGGTLGVAGVLTGSGGLTVTGSTNTSTQFNVGGGVATTNGATITNTSILLGNSSVNTQITTSAILIQTTATGNTSSLLSLASTDQVGGTLTLQHGNTTSNSTIVLGSQGGNNASIELGGTNAAFIDFKTPFADDFDTRLLSNTSGFYITAGSSTSANVLNITSANVNIGSGKLFIDNVNSRVGINNTAPLVALRVTGDADISSTANVQGNANVGGTLGVGGVLTGSGGLTVTGQTNTTTLYAATSANVGTAFIANATGIYTTGVANAFSHTVGTAFIANSSLVTAPAINVVGATNTATLFVTTSANVGTAFIANATGIYTTGVANAFSHTVSTSFIANSSLVTAPAINVVGATNTSVLNVTGLTTLSGNTSLAAYTEKMVSITATATTNDLDLKVASVFRVSMPAVTANLRFINPPATGAVSATLIIQYTGISSITLQGNTAGGAQGILKYAYNSAPTLTQFAGNTDILSAITYDGGASYIVSPAFMKFTS